jgi:hypothetical protein
MVAELQGLNVTNRGFTTGFHLVNVGLHGLVTGLVTESARYVLENDEASLIAGLVFGLHPVHAEAVSNITSRGELLMSLFFLVAFLSFASHLNKSGWKSIVAIYLVPWVCMTLSMFSKEQGATTLISLVFYDFLLHHSSVVEYLPKLLSRDTQALSFLFRTIILAIQTVLVCAWRYWLNGESSPDFIFDQNPAGFSEDRFVRIFSVNWVYCLYLFDMLLPYRL